MTKKELETLTYQSCRLITEVADFIRGEIGKVKSNEIVDKSWNSLVSYVDETAEKQLVEGLKKLLPDSVFLTEEATITREKGDYQWIIDPLDGTTNFLHQLPCFSISVALRYKEETILGIVYEINQRECFYAFKNGGAFLNGKKIEVTKTNELKDSLIATGFPYYDYEQIKSYLNVLENLMTSTRGIRRFGSAAVDLAYVACGRFDAFFEYSLNAWDVAAGAFIVQEAGGQVVDFSGGDNFLFGKEIVASNEGIYDDILLLIQKEFKGINT
jgi:myo-inositol-1(or 4)-monophosphatase